MQTNPFDRTAREARLAELCTDNEETIHALFEFQNALLEGRPMDIAIKRQNFLLVLQSHF